MKTMNNKQKIIVICGPTASGKSDIAVKLAKNIGGEVISADSRQVYENLDIGTGKITKKEMQGVPHHLIDVCSPTKNFTVSDFVKKAKKAIQEIGNRGKVPIICGGTGFYIDALLGKKQIPEVPQNKKLRKELESKNVEELFEILKKFDIERSKNIDAKNPVRLIRAIEIAKALGKVPTFTKVETPYNILKIGIAPMKPLSLPSPQNGEVESPILLGGGLGVGALDKSELKKRIHTRLLKRIKIGMIKEAGNLHKKGLSFKRMEELGLEYKYLSYLIQDKISRRIFKNISVKAYLYFKNRLTSFLISDIFGGIQTIDLSFLNQVIWRLA
jgi:tRNA dimethylallyltransferase